MSNVDGQEQRDGLQVLVIEGLCHSDCRDHEPFVWNLLRLAGTTSKSGLRAKLSTHLTPVRSKRHAREDEEVVHLAGYSRPVAPEPNPCFHALPARRVTGSRVLLLR